MKLIDKDGNQYFEKDPEATLDYEIPLKNWLNGDSLTTVTATAPVGSDITVTNYTNTADTITVWLSGGTVGRWYQVRVHFETLAGRKDDRTLRIFVKQK